jgi:2-phosphosulfolactate phosphatase
MQQERAHLEWGVSGARRCAERGDVAVVVDVLRFSTTVAAAAAKGALVFPYRGRDPVGYARQHRAELARGNSKFSMSPSSFDSAEPGDRVVIHSANGSTIAMLAGRSGPVLTGALVNASAAATAASCLAAERGCGLTVIAGGERPRKGWQDERSYEFRPAIEDWLGAGAVLSRLGGQWDLSPEAEVAVIASEGARAALARLIRECESGQELYDEGLGADVEFAVRVDCLDVAPILEGDAFRAVDHSR